jgi:hypothetical protein
MGVSSQTAAFMASGTLASRLAVADPIHPDSSQTCSNYPEERLPQLSDQAAAEPLAR